MSQALRTKPIDTGTLRLNPKTLALTAVHRQTAASASTSPPKSRQQGLFGGVPTWAPSRPPRTLAHAPNLIASRGQVPDFREFGNADGGLTRGNGKAGGRIGVSGIASGGLEGSGKRGGSLGGEVGELDLWMWCLCLCFGGLSQLEVVTASPNTRRLRNRKRTDGRLDIEVIFGRGWNTRDVGDFGMNWILVLHGYL